MVLAAPSAVETGFMVLCKAGAGISSAAGASVGLLMVGKAGFTGATSVRMDFSVGCTIGASSIAQQNVGNNTSRQIENSCLVIILKNLRVAC